MRKPGFSETAWERSDVISNTGNSPLGYRPVEYKEPEQKREGRETLAPGCYRRTKARTCP